MWNSTEFNWIMYIDIMYSSGWGIFQTLCKLQIQESSQMYLVSLVATVARVRSVFS